MCFLGRGPIGRARRTNLPPCHPEGAREALQRDPTKRVQRLYRSEERLCCRKHGQSRALRQHQSAGVRSLGRLPPVSG
jgi:hypothetical protein